MIRFYREAAYIWRTTFGTFRESLSIVLHARGWNVRRSFASDDFHGKW
jgi:hypothetical protein